MGEPNETFYSNLPEFSDFGEAVSASHHQPVPDDWHVVITDVRGSTEAIESGRYRDVNALGVASIIALGNAIPDVELPFVFGGDGATILVPGRRLEAAQSALRGLRSIAREAFSLELRVSHVSIRALTEAGAPFLVARYRLSEHITLAAFSGAGVSLAEEWIKDRDGGARFAVSEEGPAEANLQGFECRWEPAESRRGNMVSLLVVALTSEVGAREQTYRRVLTFIDELVEAPTQHPLSEEQMRLKPYGGDFSVEARLISTRPEGPGYKKAESKARRHALAGRGMMKLGVSAGGFNGATYMREFLQNTDFRKFDGALRMVLDLEVSAIGRLRDFLQNGLDTKELAYGMHLSGSALITCMVKSYGGNHVHFVDGSDGGYALAAKQLKSQLRALADGSWPTH